MTGSKDGIAANFGGNNQDFQPTGSLYVKAAGPVTGTNRIGIYADNYGQTGSTTTIMVTKTGVVQGATSGVEAYARNNQNAVSITNDGTIQNLSGLSTDLAIESLGGSTNVVNNGIVTGVVNFNFVDPNNFTNTGTWNTAGGTNTFAGSDTLTNTRPATIVAAASGASSP